MAHLAVAIAPLTRPDERTLQASVATWRIVVERLERSERLLANRILALVNTHDDASSPLRITIGTEDGQRILAVAGVAG